MTSSFEMQESSKEKVIQKLQLATALCYHTSGIYEVSTVFEKYSKNYQFWRENSSIFLAF